MNKFLLIFFVLVALLFLPSVTTQAAQVWLCQIQNPTGPAKHVDPSVGNSIDDFIANNKGFVPCGITETKISSWQCTWTTGGREVRQNVNANSLLEANILCGAIKPQGSILRPPAVMIAGDITSVWCPCQLAHIFILILKIVRFLRIFGTLIAGLMIVIGGIFILLSGGPGGKNPVTGIAAPNLYSTGRKMIFFTIIGVVVMFCAWLIINVLMTVLGYIGVNTWWDFTRFF